MKKEQLRGQCTRSRHLRGVAQVLTASAGMSLERPWRRGNGSAVSGHRQSRRVGRALIQEGTETSGASEYLRTGCPRWGSSGSGEGGPAGALWSSRQCGEGQGCERVWTLPRFVDYLGGA